MAKGSGGTKGTAGSVSQTRKTEEWKDFQLHSVVDTSVDSDEFYRGALRNIAREGISWKEESSLQYLNPNNISPSEWNYATKREGNKKVAKYVKMGGEKMPPIIAVKTDKGYEAIDGIHRTWAAQEIGMKVPAIVISRKLADALSNDSIARTYLYDKYKNAVIKNRK